MTALSPSNSQLTPHIHATGKLDFEEYLAVPALHTEYRSPPLFWQSWPGCIWGVVIFFVLGWISRHPGSVFAWICLICMVTCFVTFSYLAMKHQRRSWENSQLQKTTFAYTFTTEGVKSLTHFHPWSDFSGFCDTENVLLLYLDGEQLFVVPRRWFLEEDGWARLIQHLGHLDHMEILRR